MQTDDNISTEALAVGPGPKTEYSFVESGTTYRDLEGGDRTYSFYYLSIDDFYAQAKGTGLFHFPANPGTLGTKGTAGGFFGEKGDDGEDGSDGATAVFNVTMYRDSSPKVE